MLKNVERIPIMDDNIKILSQKTTLVQININPFFEIGNLNRIMVTVWLNQI